MIKRFICVTICMCMIICSSLILDEDNGQYSKLASADNHIQQIVIIDAGHGGFDGGCSGIDGTLEKDINLEIAIKLENILDTFGFKTIMVRTTDTAVNTDGYSIRQKKVSDIKFRQSLMTKYPDSIYLCIHQNRYSSPTVSGMQIFYRPEHDASKLLAEYLQNSITSGIEQSKKRPIKPCSDDVYLIHNATSTAVLIECGFLSNQNDLNNLKNDHYQRKFCYSIVSGLLNSITQN